ncbi:MAG: MFS transporter [Candidatus Baldrarchaeia archaeon]
MTILLERRMAFHTSILISILVGGFLASKIREKSSRVKFLYFWIILGGFASYLLGLSSSKIFIAFLGFSVGLGLPLCLAYTSNLTRVEERGRVYGITVLFSLIILALFSYIGRNSSFIRLSLTLSVWRFLGLAIIFLHPKKLDTVNEVLTFKSRLFLSKTFLLYLFPWLIFSIIDQFGFIMQPLYGGVGAEQLIFIKVTELIVAGLSSFLTGFLLDSIGRRRVVVLGFVIIGVTYALVGLLPPTYTTLLIFSVVEGAAWGIFTVTFSFVLWADISSPSLREKSYALGISPPFVACILGYFLVPFLSGFSVSSVFFFACIFLFISLLPLWYTPETLPEEIIERRRFRRYIAKAKKILG